MHMFNNSLSAHTRKDVRPDLPHQNTPLSYNNIRLQDEQASQRAIAPAYPNRFTFILGFFATWGGNWMWNDIDAGEYPKDDMK
jgi:hypothetical protein